MKRKREILNSQREQLAANLNATVGAIQMLDELIAECEAATSAAEEEKAS
jgi:hypothetical protein